MPFAAALSGAPGSLDTVVSPQDYHIKYEDDIDTDLGT